MSGSMTSLLYGLHPQVLYSPQYKTWSHFKRQFVVKYRSLAAVYKICTHR